VVNNKYSYYNGTEEPKPKQKQYKSDPAIVVQPRFKEPLFHNYDLYETDGVDGKAKHSPGTGLYQNMDKYDSVSDFRKSKKHLRDKYKADDSWIHDDGSIKKRKNARRLALLSLINKFAIDFVTDDEIDSTIDEENGFNPIGGLLAGKDNEVDSDKPYDFILHNEYVE
jgi:hypothetical protein